MGPVRPRCSGKYGVKCDGGGEHSLGLFSCQTDSVDVLCSWSKKNSCRAQANQPNIGPIDELPLNGWN